MAFSRGKRIVYALPPNIISIGLDGHPSDVFELPIRIPWRSPEDKEMTKARRYYSPHLSRHSACRLLSRGAAYPIFPKHATRTMFVYRDRPGQGASCIAWHRRQKPLHSSSHARCLHTDGALYLTPVALSVIQLSTALNDTILPLHLPTAKGLESSRSFA
ncbi:hypothetical protein BV25DRAFT_465582 [Artomyces pyxidatus]|uniref:Uncharacterized protein n=1 Tax=Artomyces pyxidatus TaxID=48021 RepID=A0ACB8T536_9AGAM|nr:hypothetical protein BV25DRAFT_465582 [Artomyces pyxidatus]